MRLWIAVKMTIVLTILLGIVYPLAMTGLAHVLFPAQAEGSLIERNGTIIGSSLIGQNFAAPRYFHPRPSSAGDKGYDATSSSGSNSGPTNKSYIDAVRDRAKALREAEPGLNHSEIPVDMVTASGSGLDPDITPAAAAVQVARVAQARHLSEDVVLQAVQDHTRGRWLRLIGEPRVNVLELNLALDDTPPAAARASSNR